MFFFFFFSSRRRHTRFDCDWSSDVCSSDLYLLGFDPGIDHLLFAQQVDAAAGPPSRLAFQSALNLLLVGAAVLLERRNTVRAHVGVQLLAVAAAVVAVGGVTAHAFPTRLLYRAVS